MNDSIYITPLAIDALNEGLDFYTRRAVNLKFSFTNEVDGALKYIAAMPATCGYRK